MRPPSSGWTNSSRLQTRVSLWRNGQREGVYIFSFCSVAFVLIILVFVKLRILMSMVECSKWSTASRGCMDKISRSGFLSPASCATNSYVVLLQGQLDWRRWHVVFVAGWAALRTPQAGLEGVSNVGVYWTDSTTQALGSAHSKVSTVPSTTYHRGYMQQTQRGTYSFKGTRVASHSLQWTLTKLNSCLN